VRMDFQHGIPCLRDRSARIQHDIDGYVSKPADIEELLDRAAMTGVSELLPYDAFPRQLRRCSRVVAPYVL
jgi:hypothetical protein